MKVQPLDSLRGVAALVVALYHSGFAHGGPSAFRMNGGLMVDFFFVLSGFVMALAYRERIAQGMSFVAFLIRRLGRIWPVHMTVLLLWLPIIWITAVTAPGTTGLSNGQSFLEQALLLNAIGLQPGLSWNYPAWSIGAELAAYIVFFAVVVLLGARLTAPVALALSVGAYALVVAQGAGTLQVTYDFGALRCLGGFFLGVAVHAFGRMQPRGTVVEGAAVGACLILLLQPDLGLGGELVLVLCFAVVIYVLAAGRGTVARILGWRPLIWLGTVSYGLYMIHAAVFQLLFLWAFQHGRFEVTWVETALGTERLFWETSLAPMLNLVALTVSLVLAALAYRLVEAPGRRWSRALADDWQCRHDDRLNAKGGVSAP